MPRGDRLATVLQRFEDMSALPQIGGAIDESHIPIKAPREDPDAYYNWKGFHSIVPEGVGSFLKFSDIFVVYPVRVHDARVLSNSGLFEIAQASGTAFPGGPQRIIEGI